MTVSSEKEFPNSRVRFWQANNLQSGLRYPYPVEIPMIHYTAVSQNTHPHFIHATRRTHGKSFLHDPGY